MKLLLDTHALLWAVLDHPRLPVTARKAIADDANEVWYSVASIWETAIKVGLGKLREAEGFLADFRAGTVLATDGYSLLEISADHAIDSGLLDIPHRDPFDRMLIAQAQREGLTLVSNERLFDSFGVERLWD